MALTKRQIDTMVRNADAVERHLADAFGPLPYSVRDLCCHIKALAAEVEELRKGSPPLPDDTERLGCDLCGDQVPLLLKARCHLTAPLQVTLDSDTLLLRCYLPECGRQVARFKIERRMA